MRLLGVFQMHRLFLITWVYTDGSTWHALSRRSLPVALVHL